MTFMLLLMLSNGSTLVLVTAVCGSIVGCHRGVAFSRVTDAWTKLSLQPAGPGAQRHIAGEEGGE